MKGGVSGYDGQPSCVEAEKGRAADRMRASARTFRTVWVVIWLASLSVAVSADEPHSRSMSPPVAPAVQPQLRPRGRRVSKPVIKPPVETVFQYPALAKAVEQAVALEPISAGPRTSATSSSAERAAEQPAADQPAADQPAPIQLPQRLPEQSLAELTGLDAAGDVDRISFEDRLDSRVAVAKLANRHMSTAESRAEMAAFVPWWQTQMREAQRIDSQLLPVTLDEVIFQALAAFALPSRSKQSAADERTGDY